MRCKACAGARADVRTALASRIDEELSRGDLPPRDGLPCDDALAALPAPKGGALPISCSASGQILLIDVIDGFSTPSPYGTRIGGLPGVAAPQPLVSAWRIMTGECIYERGIFALGGRAAEAAATIGARIADPERPLRAIIVCGLGTSRAALAAFERSLFPVVSAFVASGGRVAFPTTRGHALVRSGFFRRCWGAQWGAARRGRLTWSRAPSGARLGEAAEFGFACEGECSFIYRYILRESCSQFDSLPLTSLTISLFSDLHAKPRLSPTSRSARSATEWRAAQAAVALPAPRGRGTQRSRCISSERWEGWLRTSATSTRS
jgi:hypothetical protein